jgi:hypothetical protein
MLFKKTDARWSVVVLGLSSFVALSAGCGAKHQNEIAAKIAELRPLALETCVELSKDEEGKPLRNAKKACAIGLEVAEAPGDNSLESYLKKQVTLAQDGDEAVYSVRLLPVEAYIVGNHEGLNGAQFSCESEYSTAPDALSDRGNRFTDAQKLAIEICKNATRAIVIEFAKHYGVVGIEQLATDVMVEIKREKIAAQPDAGSAVVSSGAPAGSPEEKIKNKKSKKHSETHRGRMAP